MKAVRKLKREYAALEAEPPHEGITVRPLESNFLHAHFLLAGEVFYHTPYEGGVYHGVLKFPKEYPFKPPSIIMRTPSGRFAVNEKICFSMSDFHPETWVPSWTISTIVNGFVSFMNDDEITTGGLRATSSQRIQYAKLSLENCRTNDPLAFKIFASELESIRNDRKYLGSSWPPQRKEIQKPKHESSSTTSTNKSETVTNAAPLEGPGKNAAKNKKKREKEKRKKLATKFLATLDEEVPHFLSDVRMKLGEMAIDVADLVADHVCYRTESLEQYTSLVEALSSSEACSLLVESEIGGRQIATFKLASSIKSSSGNHEVDVVEIPSPKEGRPYKGGLEHVEYVIGNSQNDSTSPANDEQHQATLEQWLHKHPHVEWDTKALHKESNPDVSVKLALPLVDPASAKFHLLPLEKVIQFEVKASEM